MGFLYSYVHILLFTIPPGLTLFSSQAGLFSSVLAAFVFSKIQDLKVNPADQSVYYQKQSSQFLAQISQQIAAIGTQVLINPIPFPPTPFPDFQPSTPNRTVNILWLLSLICSLFAALLATLIQQWVRAYMRIFQQSSNPLKTARIRLFLFEGVEVLPVVAEFVPVLLHVSLLLFLLGLCYVIKDIDTVVFAIILVPIALCVILYFYFVMAPISKPHSPFRTPFSSLIWRFIRKLELRRRPFNDRSRGTVAWHHMSLEAQQVELAMKPTEDREARDARGVRWLVGNIDGSNEMEAFVLAIPGSFNQEWGRQVWKVAVGYDAQSAPSAEVRPASGHPSLSQGSTIEDLCRCVRYLFDTYENEGSFMTKEARRRRVHGCVETAASLVCCAGVELDSFGEVGSLLSELGHNERTNDLSTIRSNPLFAVRWTCLSLVVIRQMVGVNRLQELAKFAVNRIARFQAEYGASDATALEGAQTIDEHLTKAWEHVKNLRLALERGDTNRTEEEIREILNDHNVPISELERIAGEVHGMEDVDWRISLLQDAMDEVTHNLTRRLPCVFFDRLKLPGPILISEAFDFPLVDTTPVPPRLIFPGQQIQSLCTLGQGLRDIIDRPNPARITKTLESVWSIPISLPRVDLMKRQLWRLLDLRDGNGLGFTIELLFLALRGLSSSSSSPELKEAFYMGTFKVITSHWEKSKDSIGTQRILLDLICDLVVKGRGVFSDFPYPDYIVKEALELVQKMIAGHRGSRSHIEEVVEELENVNARDVRDEERRKQALNIIYPP